MADILYGYNNQLWKCVHNFQYTGTTEECDLDPGKYLLICHGAQGGMTPSPNCRVNYGGVAYGILNLKQKQKFYVNVGGNGGPTIDNSTPGLGGFNGGGNGGKSYLSSYAAGAGGGGATDIRLMKDDGSMSPENPSVNKSLLTRIIVAGGGGGGTNMSSANANDINYAGFGGGVVGGFVESNQNIINKHSYPTQTSGFSFGNGMDAIDRGGNQPYSKGAEGSSGAGGGWFGGFACGSPYGAETSTNGGGGSGYVLTKDSYKPDGYNVPEDFYLEDTFMDCGLAINPQALICVPVPFVNVGDTIIFPCVGRTEHIRLPMGTFVMKCYGGDGGCRLDLNKAARGGYAEGTVTIPHETDVYVTVGGSGIGTGPINPTYGTQYHQTAMFNGGGAPGVMGNTKSSAGGGATDIRIGSDSLYSRIIVAGGAGGFGAYIGGVGGGATGGTATGGYGTTPGPGTQTESPQNADYPTINGGFGYGGNGVAITNSSQFSGAGGGGWFGGSGTQPNASSDNDRGGCGGSGYVLTEDSYKPDGYLVGSDYYLTNTSLVSGGNNLPIGHTQAVIEVVDSVYVSILCHDAEGYKRYDQEEGKWVYLSNSLTPDMFDEYGYHTIPTDEGLLDEYDVLLHDIADKISGVSVDVVPPEQKISTTVKHDMDIRMIKPDIECDEEVYDYHIDANRSGHGFDSKITLDAYIHKKNDSDSPIRVYCIQVFDI